MVKKKSMQEINTQLKDELTAEAVRLENTIANGVSLSAVKAARTRWENKNRAYWETVREAREKLAASPGTGIRELCDEYGIDPTDLMEVAL